MTDVLKNESLCLLKLTDSIVLILVCVMVLWTICSWLAGLATVEDAFVWASAIRYVFNSSLKDKYVNSY